MMVLLLLACPWVDQAVRDGVADRDGDGLAAVAFGGRDCDDGDAAIGGPAPWYADVAGDGLGDEADVRAACAGGVGLVAVGGDCDDTDARVGAASVVYPDGDGDGFAPDGAAGAEGCPGPDDATALGDCDDAAPQVWPGAPEDCLATEDRDCDGEVGVRCTDDALVGVVQGIVDGLPASEVDFPAAITAVDVDGDGRVEVVASLPYAYLIAAFDAPTLLGPGDHDVDDAMAEFSVFQPTLGRALAAADVTGDAGVDLLAGAPPSDPRETDFGARVLAFELPGTSASSEDAAIAGLDALGYFGSTITPVPDADGAPAVVVGAIFEGEGGAAWLVPTEWSGVRGVDEVGAVELVAPAPLPGLDPPWFGHSAAPLRTASGARIAISAPFGTGGVEGAGTVLVWTPSWDEARVEVDATAGSGVFGRVGYEGFGFVVAAWDHDGDGLDSLVSSGPLGKGQADLAGAVYVIHAPDTLAGWVSARAADVILLGDDHTGAPNGATLGVAVCVPGDMSGDGLDDLAMGAPGSDSPGHAERAGAVYVAPGGIGDGEFDVETVSWSRYGDRGELGLGRVLGPAGDLDEDGRADLAVGMPGWTHAGDASVIGAFGIWLGGELSAARP